MVHNLKVAASEHPIKSVTVFKTAKAEIVRTFSLELEVGLSSFFELSVSSLSALTFWLAGRSKQS
jgi:hypothetical protein